MNILFLNYEFPPIGGGASPVSLEIARGYAAAGHRVDVVTMSYRDLPAQETIDGVQVYRVKSLRSRKEICHPWEQLTYLFSARRFLRKRLRETSYDICHAHFIIPTGVLALWLKKRFHIPYIVTSHGSDVLGYNKRFKRLYPMLAGPWKKIIAGAQWVTAPSDFLIQKIRENTTDGQFRTIPNGLDLKKFRPQKKEKKILIVARLFVNKGVQDILEALKGLDLGPWSVDIVGDGPYRGALESQATASALGERVRFLGWLDNSSPMLKTLYGRASIFISASYFESFGLTLLEAVSAGCYPLVSDIGGHRSVIDDDAYYFRPGDSEGLRKKLRTLINKKTPPPAIPVERFSWKKIMAEYLSLIGD